MADKAIAADSDEFANESMGLDARFWADFGVRLDLDEWPYERVVSDRATVKVYRFDDSDVFAETNVFDLGCVDVRSIGHNRAALDCCYWRRIIGERFSSGKQYLDNRESRLVWFCLQPN